MAGEVENLCVGSSGGLGASAGMLSVVLKSRPP